MTIRDETTLVRVKRDLVAQVAIKAAEEGTSIRVYVENVLKESLK